MTFRQKMNTVGFDVISKYRGEIFGILALSIVVFHYFSYANNAYHVSKLFQPFMYSWGVDGFMILSGQGLYYSISKNNDIGTFYKKRALRLLPSYLIIALIYIIWKDVFYSPSAITFIQDLFFYNSFTRSPDRINTGSWFVATILFLYMIYPFIHKFINNKLRNTVVLMSFFTLLVILSYYFAYELIFVDYEIGMGRIAAFVFGSYLGYLSKERRPVTVKGIIGIIAIFPIALISKVIQVLLEQKNIANTEWFDKIWQGFVAFALIFMIAFGFDLFENGLIRLKAILRFFGAISLELYLCHVEGMRIFVTYVPMEKMNMLTWLLAYSLIITISVIVAVVVSKISKKLFR